MFFVFQHTKKGAWFFIYTNSIIWTNCNIIKDLFLAFHNAHQVVRAKGIRLGPSFPLFKCKIFFHHFTMSIFLLDWAKKPKLEPNQITLAWPKWKRAPDYSSMIRVEKSMFHSFLFRIATRAFSGASSIFSALPFSS